MYEAIICWLVAIDYFPHCKEPFAQRDNGKAWKLIFFVPEVNFFVSEFNYGAGRTHYRPTTVVCLLVACVSIQWSNVQFFLLTCVWPGT